MKKIFGVIYIIVGTLIFFGVTLNCVFTLPDLLEMEGTDTGGFMAGFIIVCLGMYVLSVFVIRKGVKRFKAERKDFKGQLDEF